MNLDQLRKQIKSYEADIDSARAAKNFDLVEEVYEQMLPLQDKLEAAEKEIKFQKEMQEMTDFYDDEKNRDEYTSHVIDMLCPEIINRPLKVH